MFVCVEIDSKEVIDPTLVGISPDRDLKVFGPFDTAHQASIWIQDTGEDKGRFVILALEWHRKDN